MHLEVFHGEHIDMAEFEGRVHVPSTNAFSVIQYSSSNVGKRLTKIFSCDYCNCGKLFRKWHNLFDHLRVHTREKPFECPVEGCLMKFNQVSNQKKHLDVHKHKPMLRCKKCKIEFPRARIVNHYELNHSRYTDEAWYSNVLWIIRPLIKGR